MRQVQSYAVFFANIMDKSYDQTVIDEFDVELIFDQADVQVLALVACKQVVNCFLVHYTHIDFEFLCNELHCEENGIDIKIGRSYRRV